eukprot:270159_1
MLIQFIVISTVLCAQFVNASTHSTYEKAILFNKYMNLDELYNTHLCIFTNTLYTSKEVEQDYSELMCYQNQQLDCMCATINCSDKNIAIRLNPFYVNNPECYLSFNDILKKKKQKQLFHVILFLDDALDIGLLIKQMIEKVMNINNLIDAIITTKTMHGKRPKTLGDVQTQINRNLENRNNIEPILIDLQKYKQITVYYDESFKEDLNVMRHNLHVEHNTNYFNSWNDSRSCCVLQ